MAQSPAHRFGQAIGNLLESAIRPQLDDFCQLERLYLDSQNHIRPARKGKKVAWTDGYGNTHDLDFVIEQGGTDQAMGDPLAFIEVAWRRYTKHSRNKAQEIQGAILPLAERFRWNNPFLGAVLAGEFTLGSLEQLRSLGFHVLYFPYDTLVAAFAPEGIDIRFDESTPDAIFGDAADRIAKASKDTLGRVRQRLIEANQAGTDEFFGALGARLRRRVTSVAVTPVFGKQNVFVTIRDAVCFVEQFPLSEGSAEFRRFELHVAFSNGDRVDASFDEKDRARSFLTFVQGQ